jgi:divalent metal cation (Fe/Co/Zn/Cd) transporter
MPIPLVEPSEREAVRQIRRRIESIGDVRACKDVRMSFTRKKPYVYIDVWLKGNPGYEGIHRISSYIEAEVRSVVPNARIGIRSEPTGGVEPKNIWALVKKIAEEEPGSRGAHNIHFQDLGGKLGVDFHLEVSSGMTVKQAHELSARIEKKLMEANLGICEVVIHEESVSELISSERSGHGTEIRWYLEHVLLKFPGVRLVHPPTIRQMGEKFHVILRIAFDPGTKIEETSDVSSRLDAAIRGGYPTITRVDIVLEPLQ